MKTEIVLEQLKGKTYKEVVASLSAETHDGGCCGFGEHNVADVLKDIPNRDEAILVQVVRTDYDSPNAERVVLNFIFDLGESKGLILGHEIAAGSGSGWAYGATCTLFYDKEQIAQVNW
ncbi:hypothetical protein CPT_Maja_071 [Burkholderia phage Maja]|uniref:Uncharacterized protein n=1 Tax=Burkholderia phage Maja TaxID=2767571 RepID=A0A7S6R791_9CAUD|nr:hypothetical protein CPT_Maja_071 [Burkholderia phage Maja]